VVGGVKPGDVMAEAARALLQVEGVRQSWAFPPDDIGVAPSGYVSYPQQGAYQQAYGRGEDGMTDFPIVLIAGPPGERKTHDMLMGWVAGSGPQSIVAHFEGWSWESCDDLTVDTWEVIPETVGGVAYLAVMFKATVIGPGGD
jgi:hypothetical protein